MHCGIGSDGLEVLEWVKIESVVLLEKVEMVDVKFVGFIVELK